ncbi:hypothetical protein AcetOrient_orf03427 [Acetobacter orientalis]|uniref:Uncharacterized protein n=1 Tax=Acetobacter orientalis TaxID=146474 RepID=A0A2Z5ZJR8_9PROT|nr:hypothetical protein AcetOrient_orf03427 [Acetobacter orientalis]
MPVYGPEARGSLAYKKSQTQVLTASGFLEAKNSLPRRAY